MKRYIIPKILFNNIDRISMVEKMFISYLSSESVKSQGERRKLSFTKGTLLIKFKLSFEDIVMKNYHAIHVLYMGDHVEIEFKQQKYYPITYEQTIAYDPDSSKVLIKETDVNIQHYKNMIKSSQGEVEMLQADVKRLKKQVSDLSDQKNRYKKDNENYLQFYQNVLPRISLMLEEHENKNGLTAEEQDLYGHINDFVMDKYSSSTIHDLLDDLGIITIAEE